MNEQMQVWAHDYAMKHDNGSMSVEVLVHRAWQYAEAMQAQAEQRRAPEPDLDTWQPDWNLAPQGYDWFFKNADGRTGFATQKPHIDLDTSKWMVMGDGCVYECKMDCPIDWDKSLRSYNF